MEQKISDKIISKAVDLWCQALQDPRFDNGDRSTVGVITGALASMNMARDKASVPAPDQAIEVFRSSLTNILKTSQDENGCLNSWLSCDYHPGEELAQAAKDAGIPLSQFSCKSSVSLYPDSIQSSFGYGTPHTYHYPVEGGWVSVRLSGADIGIVLDSVLEGNPLGLTFEKDR